MKVKGLKITFLNISKGIEYSNIYSPYQVSIQYHEVPVVINNHVEMEREELDIFDYLVERAHYMSNIYGKEYVVLEDGRVLDSRSIDNQRSLADKIVYSTLD